MFLELFKVLQIRPVFNKTVVYLTGGFRTAPAMIDAIKSNATQGIGLGRPITAEPDLPKKILEGDVTSAIQDHLPDLQAALRWSRWAEQAWRKLVGSKLLGLIYC